MIAARAVSEGRFSREEVQEPAVERRREVRVLLPVRREAGQALPVFRNPGGLPVEVLFPGLDGRSAGQGLGALTSLGYRVGDGPAGWDTDVPEERQDDDLDHQRCSLHRPERAAERPNQRPDGRDLEPTHARSSRRGPGETPMGSDGHVPIMPQQRAAAKRRP